MPDDQDGCSLLPAFDIRRAIGLGAALAMTSFLGCEPPRPLPHGILLITLDTTRADHLSAYGYERATTPTLDRLALRATRLAHLEIAYEDLTSQPPAFKSVCDFLEVDCGGQPPRSRLAKRVQRPRAETIRNYAEVLSALEAAGLRGPSP